MDVGKGATSGAEITGPITVRASATSANLGPGFDSFGLCLTLADEVTAEKISAGTEVVVHGEGAGTVPTDENHLVAASIRHAFDTWGVRQPGLRLTCRNAIPHGRGLGSSAAAIVAGIRLAQALTGRSLSDHEAIALAADLEGHADNVAACLLGGLAIAWLENGRATGIRLEVAHDVVPVVFCAGAALATSVSRGLLDANVTHLDASANAARAGLLVAALTGRPELLLPATVDLLHQECRRPAMPESMGLVDALRATGVAAVLSGAGPSVLALCRSAQVAKVQAAAVPAGWRVLRLAVEPAGAGVVS